MPQRVVLLRDMLARLRDETYATIKRFRQDQREETSAPGDEADIARSSAETETRANLMERAEERLRLIDEALARADAGTYGICAECGEEIAIERLRILPFAPLCIDCQSKRNDARRWGRVGVAEPWRATWLPPVQGDDEEKRHEPREDNVISVSDLLEPESEPAPDEPESEAPKRRRGRPRKVQARNDK